MIARAGARTDPARPQSQDQRRHIEGPSSSRAPVVGAPSASVARTAARHRAGYHLFEISGSRRDYEIKASARGLLPGSTTIGDLGAIEL